MSIRAMCVADPSPLANNINRSTLEELQSEAGLYRFDIEEQLNGKGDIQFLIRLPAGFERDENGGIVQKRYSPPLTLRMVQRLDGYFSQEMSNLIADAFARYQAAPGFEAEDVSSE